MLKKILSVLLSVITIFGVFTIVPFYAFAETCGSCGLNLTWTLSDDGVLTIFGKGEMYDYYPSSYDHKSAPWRGNKVKKAIIKDGVTSIGDNAFNSCGNLTSVTIPDSVTSFGDRVFNFSGLTSITVSDGNMVYDSRDNCKGIAV